MKFIILSSLTLVIAGCAAIQNAQKEYVEKICNENGGYEKGMNDARAKSPMDTGFTQQCAPEVRDAAQRGYREGYSQGLASLKAEEPAPAINININGPSGSRAYFCEIHAFTATFSGFGSTETEAQQAAKAKCLTKYHEMHCTDAKCRRS